MAVVDDVRSLGGELERSYLVSVRDRLTFRVGSIVSVAFSLDERERPPSGPGPGDEFRDLSPSYPS